MARVESNNAAPNLDTGQQAAHPSGTVGTTQPVVEREYTEYLDPQFPLEERLVGAFHELHISAEQQEKIRAFLEPLRVKHTPTYEHSIRVGLLARKIGSILHLNEKALLYAGVLHDVGKALTPLQTLAKTSGWSKEDQVAIESHVIDGVRLLGGSLDFTADTILHHHLFQPNAYPTELPQVHHQYSKGSELLLVEHGRVIAIADTFDALHRINEKHGEKKALLGEEVKEKMLQFHPDRKELIEQLFQHGVLSTFILGEEHVETAELDRFDSLYEKSFEFSDTKRSARNTQRHLQIACALEPISDKADATTRYRDISPHLRLEYFQVAAINIGDAFGEMAHIIRESSICPENLYRFGLQAQIESKRNRRGGRVNQGIIELLIPIVAAQHLHDTSYQASSNEILSLASDFLKHTSSADVESLRQLKQTAYALSHYHDREVPDYAVTTVLEFYQHELLENSPRATSAAHNAEFLRGFPTISEICRMIEQSPYPHFNQKIEEAFHRSRYLHGPEVSVGFLADCVAVGIYLSLSQNPRERLVG